MAKKTDCCWGDVSPLMREYHDTEWGLPCHDDRTLFEYFVLGGAQAGLSWKTILDKREGYRKAFARFDPKKVARFTKRDVNRLLRDPGIVRNRLKVECAIHNAKRVLDVQKELGSFAALLWPFVDGKPIRGRWRAWADVPATTPASDAMSKALRDRGFKFAGSTICYAFMQAVGMVNDHLLGCPRRAACGRVQPARRKRV